ncbi:MAG: hypothetical protein ACI4OV_09795 [Victivallaceae bacterium]
MPTKRPLVYTSYSDEPIRLYGQSIGDQQRELRKYKIVGNNSSIVLSIIL